MIALTSAMDVFRECIAKMRGRHSGKRMLVHEIMSIQIFSAALIGTLAIAALYWGGQWILKNNYSRWALQWTEELNELGSPLYLEDDEESLIRLERFVESYAEIDRVAYYDRNGNSLFVVSNDTSDTLLDGLSDEQLADATAVVGEAKPYMLEGSAIDPRRFEILAPVWVEAIEQDGLFDFDPRAADDSTREELVGFVAIHLDFILFHDRLLTNIRIAILALLVLLIVFALYGRHVLQRALRSISQLEQPIRELAKGNLAVRFKPAQHQEISEIVDALETTASSLSERNAKLVKLANHDSLTGLYNRRRFIEELSANLAGIVRNGGNTALFFIDLDRFKYVNDLCGHPAGDRLIRKVADELARSVPNRATIARFGGDEFVVLLPDADRAAARNAADDITRHMRRVAHIENEHVFHIHCSIGVTIASDTNIYEDDLVAQADLACREAKAAGRNRVRFFDFDESSDSVDHEVGWMSRLRHALDNDTLELMFQPINDIRSGRTTHHEVLIRARADDGSLVSPDAFLPAAVRFGLMSEIDLWVIRNSAMAYARHRQAKFNLRLAINISANAFENEDLPTYVKETFEEFNVPPEHIVFEITESLAIRRPANVERQVGLLREMGCKLALDDFGTGYSSLSYLQKLPFDYIKIDGAFVVDLLDNTVDQKLIRLIADIGREAGMRTIAEYVEDADALTLLEELGVDMVQGFLIGRPEAEPRNAASPVSLGSRRSRKQLQV